MLAAPLSGLYLVYTVSSLAVTAAIPADKAISLACPFQYHNIVTRQAHVEEDELQIAAQNLCQNLIEDRSCDSGL